MFYLFDWFRSFLPLHNPIGFGVVDFIELGLGLMLVLFGLLGSQIARIAHALARRTAWCMAILFVLPIALRLLLALGVHPIPTPNVSDDFSYLLLGDTLAHFRLANPPHPLHRFFETFYVLQEPTYSSIYPLGQGIALAIGWVILGHPWAGVLLSSAALCPLCYWMLRGWTSPGWALAGGFLAIFEFGPLSSWMNSYWGGAFAAVGGCLVLGALPRLRASSRRLYPALLGVGFTMNLLTRPYESIFLVIAIVGYLIWWRPKLRLLQVIAMAGLAIVPAIGIMLLQNKRVTGYWSEMPYVLSQYQYGVPAALTFERDPVPHRPLTAQQEMEYKSQRAFRGGQKETLRTFLLRLEYRVRYYRFFFLAPLYLAAPLFLLALRQAKYVWVAGTLLLFAIGTNFFPAFQVHYVAAVTCLFILLSVVDSRSWGPSRAKLPGFCWRCARRILFFGIRFICLKDGALPRKYFRMKPGMVFIARRRSGGGLSRESWRRFRGSCSCL